MCQYRRDVIIRSGRTIKVDCGKCPSCLQKKANKRVRKLHDTHPDGYTPLFFGLTYANRSVPYINKYDIQFAKEGDTIPVYRDSEVCWKRTRGRRNGHYVYHRSIDYGVRILEYVALSSVLGAENLHKLENFFEDDVELSSYVGVIYKKDIYDFFKRLRQNLKRRFNVQSRFFYCQCSEYGETTCRPHFHVILWCPTEEVEIYKRAIAASWSYDDFYRLWNSIEIARDAASYVASYVNCFTSIPPCLSETKSFCPSLTYSKGVGLDNGEFSLSSILDKIDKGSLLYDAKVIKDGKEVYTPLPMPAYVINRYFAKCKGYNGFDSDTLFDIARQPAKLFRYRPNAKTRSFLKVHYNYYADCSYDDEDLHTNIVRLGNLSKRFRLESGRSRYDFAYYYVKVWRVYYSTLLKFLHDTVPLEAAFDNLPDVAAGLVDCPYMLEHVDWSKVYLDSFEHPFNKSMDDYREQLFWLKDKSRKDSNSFSLNINPNF